MSPRSLLLFAVILTALGRAEAADLPARSISSSKQFIIYCDDATLRGRVTGFAEEVKDQVLSLLGEGDRWKAPIIISLARAASPKSTPVTVRMFETPDGPSVQIEAQIGDDPKEIHLQKQIVRAVLLEIEYRDRAKVKGGETYVEAPRWLIEGALQIFGQRDLGVAPEVYQAMVQSNRLPPITDFLTLKDDDLGATARAMDAACAMCLVQLLVEQPNGRANLGRLVRHWPDLHDDPLRALARDFPGLATSANGLQKWWTLNVAHFSAADRYKGLTAADTDKAVQALLQFEVVTDKAGKKETFTLEQFPDFVKLPGNKAAMSTLHAAVIALSARANALYSPVLAEYERITALLTRGKTRGVAEMLDEVARYREGTLRRMSAIGDYLNWYEATQMGMRSDAFDSFLKAANEISEQEARIRRDDPIAKYLDQLQEEF